MRIQFWHIVVLVLVIVMLFGANRLPELARSVGESMKIFKNEIKDLTDDAPPTSSNQDEASIDGTVPKA